MTEWWTYRPSDFLMFAPRTWWRLFELHNAAAWPLQPLLALGAVALWPALRHAGALRAALVLLALAWFGVAWFFLWQRFAPIHWAAQGYALAFGVQALVLLALARRADLGPGCGGWRHRTAQALLVAALLYPLVAPLSGRPWAQAEWVALAPDPTVVATLAVLLCCGAHTGLTRGLVAVLRWGALAWLLLSAATLFTMGSAQGVVPLVAAVAALAAPRVRQPSRAQRKPM